MGVDPERYWEMPFWQLRLEMEALNNRRTDDLITLAWQIAAMERQKRLPKLEKLLETREEKAARDRESKEFVRQMVEKEASNNGD